MWYVKEIKKIDFSEKLYLLSVQKRTRLLAKKKKKIDRKKTWRKKYLKKINVRVRSEIKNYKIKVHQICRYNRKRERFPNKN